MCYVPNCTSEAFYSGTKDMFTRMQILWTDYIAELEYSNNVYSESKMLTGTVPPEFFSLSVM